jgi:hypothetical protein
MNQHTVVDYEIRRLDIRLASDNSIRFIAPGKIIHIGCFYRAAGPVYYKYDKQQRAILQVEQWNSTTGRCVTTTVACLQPEGDGIKLMKQAKFFGLF